MAQSGSFRSFLSLIALVSLIGGTFATALGLIRLSEDPSGKFISDEEYIVPALVGNTLCVIFLVWLTATIPTRSTGYKFLVIIFLILGIVGEIYMTFFFTQAPTIYATYVLIVVNFLVRTFYVLEFVQDTWSPISFGDAVTAVTSNTQKKPDDKKPEGEKKTKVELDDKAKDARKKLDEVIDKMRKDAKGIKGPTIGDSIKKFKDEIAAGKTADEAYKSAKGILKYGDDTPYTGAGRRK